MGFDTSGHHCAATLLRGDTIIATHVEDMARGQAERLMSLLDEVLRDHDLGWSDLTAIGVGVGPGNFTGVRISVSAARGLGLGLGIPVVGVSLFETTQHLGGLARTAVPAPRGQAYFLDLDTMTTPTTIPADTAQPATLSSDHTVADHVRTIARIAAKRANDGVAAPKPLYVKPPDAAPARDAPPRILP